jgi:hypothetical protein
MKFPIRKVSTLLDTNGAWQLTPALPLPTIQPTTVAVKGYGERPSGRTRSAYAGEKSCTSGRALT